MISKAHSAPLKTTYIRSPEMNPKVVIIVNSLRGGGAENAMAALNQGLNLGKYSAILIGINSCPKTVHPKTLDNEIDIGREHLSKFRHTLESFFIFKKTLKDIEPNALIVNCDLPELFAAMLLGQYKTIVVEHSSLPWAGRRILGKTVRWLLKQSDVSFVSISTKIDVWLDPSLGPKVLENLIPKQELDLTNRGIGSEPRLIFMGRLENQKCPQMFLEIQSKLDIPALVIGDGRLRQDLEQSSAARNLDIDFKGFQQNPWSFVGQEDYLVITSIFEGKPLVILEGLALGIKIFARDIPELHEEFKNYPIIFCANIEDFVNKISLERRLNNSGNDSLSGSRFDIEKHNRQALESWTKYLDETLISLD